MQPSKHATCPKCGERFELATIAENPDVEPIGMQLEDGVGSYHFFFFNHVVPTCGTTFVVRAERFLPYIQEPVPALSLAGQEGCEHHCLDLKDLQACSQPCRYASFRRHLLAMHWRHAEIANAHPTP